MNDRVTIELPLNLYKKLQTLASEGQTDPINAIAHMITEAYERRGWLQDLAALRQQILQDGGLKPGDSLIDRLRQIRQ